MIQKGHAEVVKSAAFSPNGKYLITASRDKTAKLWDVVTGHEIRSFLGHSHTVNHVEFSPDGSSVVTTSADNTAIIWDIPTGNEMFRVTRSDFVTDAVFSPNGKILATGGYDRDVIIWDIKRRIPIDTIKVGPEKGVGFGIDLSFSKDGKWLGIGEDNQKARVFETKDWEQVYEFPIEAGFCGGCIAFIDFSPDSKKLLKLGRGGPLYQIELESGKVTTKWDNEWKDVNSVSYSQDGSSILIATEKEVLKLNPINGDTLLSFSPDVNQINEAKFSPDGTTIVVSGNDKRATLFSAITGEKENVFEGILNKVDKGGLSYDPSSYWDSFIARYVKLKNIQLITADGMKLIRGKFGNKAKIWEIGSGRTVTEFSGHEKTVLGLDQSKDGKWLLTGGGDRHAKLWEISTGKLINTFKGHVNLLFESKFSHDQTKIITSSWDARVNIWDIKSGEILTRIDFGNTTGYTISFTPNDLYFVVGKLDKTLEMWELDTKSVVRTFIGHTDVVSQILFTDNQEMITTSWDGSARVWDISSGLMNQKFTTNEPLYAASISPDKKFLLTGGADRQIRFWNLETGLMEKTLQGHLAGITNIIFTPNGKRLISTDLDGVTKFWDLATNTELFEHIHIGKNDWMVKTKEGYFSATDGAREAIHFVDGTKTYELDQFFEEFYRPDLIEELLSGSTNRNIKGLNEKLSTSPPPEVKIAAIRSEDHRSAQIHLRTTDTGGGIKNLKLFHNGKRLDYNKNEWKPTRKEAQTTFYEIDISLIGGLNIFAASASSKGNIESKLVSVEVPTEIVTGETTLHLFVVGINKYQNEKLNLNYARNDAESLTQSFKENSNSLFSDIKVYELYDEKASRQAILDKLDDLAAKVRVHDVFVFYYAGHGSVVNNNFYFIPMENTRLYDEKSLEKTALRADIIQGKLEKIQALKQIIIMDACQSGGSVELLAQRGASEEKAVAQLSRSAGIHVLAAAGSDQFATEFQELGHGVFTYVLLEALNGQADGAPKDGKVTIYELKSYLDDQVPEQSQQHKGKPQYPYTFSRGNDFPLVINEN